MPVQRRIATHAPYQVLGSSRLLAKAARTRDAKETPVTTSPWDAIHCLLYKVVIIGTSGVSLGAHGPLP